MQLYGVQSTALRYFLEVARCGSISEASMRLNVAASAVSRQISKLELALDASLFERRARGMVLSEAGARRELEDLSAAVTWWAKEHAQTDVPLRISSTRS